MPSFSVIFNSLPPKLRLRFNGAPSYAKVVIEDDEASLSFRRRTTPLQMQQIQVLFQMVLLDRFLRRGTAAAREAVAEMEAQGVAGFSVGTSTFEGNNEEVRRGEILSDQLRAAIPRIAELSDQFPDASWNQLALNIRTVVKSHA